MQVITAASTKQSHPSTLKVERAIEYRFDTGHKLFVWMDGQRFYTTNRRALNPRTDNKICVAMDKLAAEF